MASSRAAHATLMFRLATLGGLTLTGDTGHPAVPQRRRLALLALLAAAGERGTSRDKLIACLWPESGGEDARHALEQLLYFLRRQLANDLFLGVDPLRLNPAVVVTDIGEFGRLVAAGDLAAAAERYQGPFLDGFYLNGAPEFERWSERERARLAGEYARVLRKLAEEAEALGRETMEIDLRRRLAASDPLAERPAAALVRALAEAGDWAEALREARQFDRRIGEEIPGAPSGGLVALVERLRSERQPGASRAPAEGQRYVIERELGRGSVATVYLARDRAHDRPVAMKVLRPVVASATDLRRFRQEIRILGRLYHPHILQLFDSGVLESERGPQGPFYVTPYVSGETLRQRIQREVQLPVETAVGIARQVADALAYAHAQGVVHRDVKPENILLEAGQAVVADFGIARMLESAGGERLSASGVVLGLPEYASPEQARGGALDGRADIYSLGCVLYEMLAGSPPFTGATRAAVLARQIGDRAPPLRTVRADLPPTVEQLLGRALAKSPDDRFPDAAAFGAALALA